MVKVSGNLILHGVSQPRDIQVTLKSNVDGSVVATGKFNVTVADHKIKIPSIVFLIMSGVKVDSAWERFCDALKS